MEADDAVTVCDVERVSDPVESAVSTVDLRDKTPVNDEFTAGVGVVNAADELSGTSADDQLCRLKLSSVVVAVPLVVK